MNQSVVFVSSDLCVYIISSDDDHLFFQEMPMKRSVCYSEDKISGLMFGLLLGDAIGAEFNDKAPDEIPPLDLDYVLAHPPRYYTGDTEMAISVFEEMMIHGMIDQVSLRERFLRRFSPWRGYGGGMLEVIERWRNGKEIDSVASSLYNGTGSFGTGAAMRVAPISAFFMRDESTELFEQVSRCALLTHTHPYGIAGAYLQASAVHLALNDIPPEEWLHLIFKLPIESAFKIKLGKVVQCLENQASAHQSVKDIGNGSEAIEAVPAALYAVLRHPDSFIDALLFAVSMGGDADTIGAMTGALSGARLGVAQIPAVLLEAFRNRFEGTDSIKNLLNEAAGG